MGYWGGNWGMMGGVSVLGSLYSIIVLIDLVLLGFWLWKQINKK